MMIIEKGTVENTPEGQLGCRTPMDHKTDIPNTYIARWAEIYVFDGRLYLQFHILLHTKQTQLLLLCSKKRKGKSTQPTERSKAELLPIVRMLR